MPPQPATHHDIATFAGGCFWCTQHEFDHVPGVVTTTAGYCGGRTEKPTYATVCTGTTGFAEAVQVVFDPSIISYEQLLSIYWHTIDPTTSSGQFCDRGSQYRPIIFYHDEHQHQAAIASKQALIKKGVVRENVVDILPASPFFPAERYHQKYYQQSPLRYAQYYAGSGRERRLKEIWGNE